MSIFRWLPAFSREFGKPRPLRPSFSRLKLMATFEFKLPDVGEGVVEGEIVKWLVKEGESVAEDQPLVEVMTDKATVTIPSPRRGRVLRTVGKEGEITKVHSTLVVLEVDGAAASQAATSTGVSA